MALIGRFVGNRKKYNDCFCEDLNEVNNFWQARCAGLAYLLPRNERKKYDKNGYFFMECVKKQGEERAVFFAHVVKKRTTNKKLANLG